MVDSDRTVVPADVLKSSGGWAFVTGLSDETWSQLTTETLELTGGTIDLSMQVADRCKAAHASGNSTRMLLLLLGNGEPWEQDYIARVAMETLRAVTPGPVDENFWRLRTRLIELGHDEAAEIRPYENRDDD